MTTYKILVIDDAFFIRNLIKKAVVKKPVKNDINFEIIGEAQNGNEGLKLVQELNPDIITVDFNIPELNGLDFAKYLKEINPKIPILMISSNTDPTFPQQVEEIGCHFLQKPFQESFLWMRLDNLVKEINTFDESKIQNTISENTKELLKEISMEVEAELEEDNIKLEEISLPKVNENKPKKKKKKKENKNILFGLEIDDSIVIKPKTDELEENKSLVKDNISEKKLSSKNNISIQDAKKPEMKLDVSIVLPIQKEEDIILEEKIESTETQLTAIVDNEEIIIEDDDQPIIIDDEDDTVIIIDNDEEIIIEDNSNDDILIEEDSLNEIEDMFILEEDDDILIEESLNTDNDKSKIDLNLKKKKEQKKEDIPQLTEKEIIIKSLKDNISYSYQNEMSYVLHVMEKLSNLKKDDFVIDEVSDSKETDKINILGISAPVIREEDLTKEDEDEEFDKLFAQFNPDLDLSEIENHEILQESIHEKEKEKLLNQSPAITKNIEIEPPKSDKVRQIYKNEKQESDQFILPTEDKPKKISIFTKIFNFFSKK